MKIRTIVLTMALCILLSIGLYAQKEGQISVWIIDSIKIMVNEDKVQLPEGMHILFHQEEDRFYVPARLVAEQLGAVVTWDDATQTIKITSTEPEEKPEEVEKEVTPMEETQEKSKVIEYIEAPVRLNLDNYQFDVYGIINTSGETLIELDIKNKNSNTATVDYKKAYLEVDGHKYHSMPDQAQIWGTSIPAFEERNDQKMSFEKIPEGTREMTIVVPIFLDKFIPDIGYTTVITELKVHVRFNDRDL